MPEEIVALFNDGSERQGDLRYVPSAELIAAGESTES
jgi:hypothetical protein